jgi:hypothetical protein
LILKQKTKSTFHQMMLALSISDIIHSIMSSLGPIPNIEGYSIGARGNQATCIASGFSGHCAHIQYHAPLQCMHHDIFYLDDSLWIESPCF